MFVMGRVKIKFPNQKALYQLSIPVRIGDINYGNHMGNDSLLSIIHEARMQLLKAWGYTELYAGGSALIMADVMIAYRSEAYYGDVLNINIYTEEVGERSFDLLYQITTTRAGATADVAHAKTGMVCFNYDTKKIVPMGEGLRNKLLNDNL
jgi:acyl-CoA thioesterase FadM